MPRSYAIIGSGAVGGFYGVLLKRAGHDVHFLLRTDFGYVQEHGLIVESRPRLLCSGPVKAYATADSMPPCDVVVIALKTTQNEALPSILPHVIKPQGVVLVLQNGLGIEDDVARIVGDNHVVGGMCFLCAYKVGPGYIHHLDYGDVMFAEHRGGITQRLKDLGADFAAAGISVELVDDLLLARWRKLVWNIPYNGLSVALNMTTDKIMADPNLVARVRRLMEEVVTLAASSGRKIEPTFVQKMLEDTAKMKPYRTSMKIDFDSGRPMELDAIYGAVLRAGQAAGVKAPEIEALYRELQELEKKSRRT